MATKSERQGAREAVAGYHEACLVELVHHVGEAVDRFRAGELDAFAVDDIVFSVQPGGEGSVEVLQRPGRVVHRQPPAGPT